MIRRASGSKSQNASAPHTRHGAGMILERQRASERAEGRSRTRGDDPFFDQFAEEFGRKGWWR